ncbi:hypothetical protein Q9966_014430 [Columba livia]|nr:hypothetical protein Q9966_014430 [Columba livia]
MSLLSVGDGLRRYICICGQAMHDIHEAQELVKEGEVILSATSWELCEQHQLMTKHLGDNGFLKGCTFLCVFGLSGERLPHEIICALQSTIQIFQSCSIMLEDVEEVSVEVTNRSTLCRVTGHPERHEYIVLGQRMNLAAWMMMMNYPGLVSCDAVTYTAAPLPAYYFKELLEKKMKAFSQTGSVYEYVGITKEWRVSSERTG